MLSEVCISTSDGSHSSHGYSFIIWLKKNRLFLFTYNRKHFYLHFWTYPEFLSRLTFLCFELFLYLKASTSPYCVPCLPTASSTWTLLIWSQACSRKTRWGTMKPGRNSAALSKFPCIGPPPRPPPHQRVGSPRCLTWVQLVWCSAVE